MRVENWESKLNKIIKDTINKKKFVIGKNDCITFPVKCVETILGKKIFKHKWKSLKDAKKLIKKLQSKDILDVVLQSAKEHNFKQIDTNKAQRGDVLYFKHNTADFNGTLGVCIGNEVMFNWSKNINLKLKEDCSIAWRIE